MNLDKSAIIKQRINEHIEIQQEILECKMIGEQIETITNWIIESLNSGGKLLICGNGGSASDASHIAGEFIGRFQKERKPFCAIALNTDVSVITSISNDYGYEEVFARQVEGIMAEKDILFGFSTSGNSLNVLNAFRSCKIIGGKGIGFLGMDGGLIKEVADISVIVPSNITARIQETHILLGHIICEIVEALLDDKKNG